MGKLIDINTKQEVADVVLSDKEFDAHIEYISNVINILKAIN